MPVNMFCFNNYILLYTIQYYIYIYDLIINNVEVHIYPHAKAIPAQAPSLTSARTIRRRFH